MRNVAIKQIREGARHRLETLVGTWRVEATFPGRPPEDAGRCTFEWMTGEQLLIQRSEPPPPIPVSLSVIAVENDASYTQHYFDARGVVRLYEMTFEDGLWTLLRTTGDFSAREFSQRFAGRFSDDGNTITGAWEKAYADDQWKPDFELTYRRA